MSDLLARLEGAKLCEGCPPIGYPTDKTRCVPCPRHKHLVRAERAALLKAMEPGQ